MLAAEDIASWKCLLGRRKLASEASADWPAEKTFSFATTTDGFDILCDVTLRRTAPGTASVYVGIEAVLNFLAPSAPDRYFESDGQRYPLRWSASRAGFGIARCG